MKLEADNWYHYEYALNVLESVDRFSGTDRYKTAVEISKNGWNTSDVVILAKGRDFPDALAGGPLAYQENAPILLTNLNELTMDTENEIERLKAHKVIILGGTGAISPKVESQLQAMGLNVERIAGKNRYETAALIAKKIPSSKAIVANGSNFPDALAVAPYASRNGIPILLTAKTKLPEASANVLNSKNSVIIVGGEGVVSNKVKSNLNHPVRYAGANRYETAAKIITHLPMGKANAYVSTGENFADALAGSVLAAKNNSPVILVSGDKITTDVAGLLPKYDRFSIYGGTNAVSNEVEQKLNDIMTK